MKKEKENIKNNTMVPLQRRERIPSVLKFEIRSSPSHDYLDQSKQSELLQQSEQSEHEKRKRGYQNNCNGTSSRKRNDFLCIWQYNNFITLR